MHVVFSPFLHSFLHSHFYVKISLCSRLSHAIVLIVNTFSEDYQCIQSSRDPPIRRHFRQTAVPFVSRGLLYSYFKMTTATRRTAIYHHHHHHLLLLLLLPPPPWIRLFDLLRHRRVAIVSWGVHDLFSLEVCS
jgi:hypothetical protein